MEDVIPKTEEKHGILEYSLDTLDTRISEHKSISYTQLDVYKRQRKT